jgi:hypothetical protein
MASISRALPLGDPGGIGGGAAEADQAGQVVGGAGRDDRDAGIGVADAVDAGVDRAVAADRDDQLGAPGRGPARGRGGALEVADPDLGDLDAVAEAVGEHLAPAGVAGVGRQLVDDDDRSSNRAKLTRAGDHAGGRLDAGVAGALSST